MVQGHQQAQCWMQINLSFLEDSLAINNFEYIFADTVIFKMALENLWNFTVLGSVQIRKS